MGKKAQGSRLPIPSILYTVIDKIFDCSDWITVGTWLRRCCPKHVGDDFCMTNLLVAHVLDQELLFSTDPCGLELLRTKILHRPMEKIEFNIFLIQSQCLERNVMLVLTGRVYCESYAYHGLEVKSVSGT